MAGWKRRDHCLDTSIPRSRRPQPFIASYRGVTLPAWKWITKSSTRYPFRDGSLDRPCPDRPCRGALGASAISGAFRSLRKSLHYHTFSSGETLLAFTTREDVNSEIDDRTGVFARARRDGAFTSVFAESGILVRPLDDVDLGRVQDLRSVVRWSADPRAFDLLRGSRDARWTVAEAPNGSLAGMVGAVPLGAVGVLCHLAVHHDYRGLGLGAGLSSWAIAYLRSRGARLIRLYSTRRAEGLYLSLGFELVAPRTVYRLEETPRGMLRRERTGGHRVETMLLGDLPEVYGADRWSYRADRSALIFAALRLYPGGGLVARDASGRVKGFLVRSSSPGATRIGPFLAATPDVARQLLSRALCDGGRGRDCAGTPFEVIVTGAGESPAHDLFEEFGFRDRADRLRMELGEAPTLRPASSGGLTDYGTTPYLAT